MCSFFLFFAKYVRALPVCYSCCKIYQAEYLFRRGAELDEAASVKAALVAEQRGLERLGVGGAGDSRSRVPPGGSSWRVRATGSRWFSY